jgi:hypothetical protein
MPAADSTAANYEQELMLALLARMHEACKKAKVRLVVLEIPAHKGLGAQNDPRDFVDSIPEALHARVRERCDLFLPARQTLGEWRGAAELFVAHGQQHISETAHLLLAKALADALGR